MHGARKNDDGRKRVGKRVARVPACSRIFRNNELFSYFLFFYNIRKKTICRETYMIYFGSLHESPEEDTYNGNHPVDGDIR